MKCRNHRAMSLLWAGLLIFAMPGSGAADELPKGSVLTGVSFVKNTVTLEDGSIAALEDLLKELLADPTVSIEIRCRVTPSGDERHDSKLSQHRAEVLRRWLMARGVAFYRVTVADANMPTSVAGLPPPDRPSWPPATGRSGSGMMSPRPPKDVKMAMRGFHGAALALWALVPWRAEASGAATARDLREEAPIERATAAGEEHVYRLELTAGRFVKVAVEQRGVDVVLALADPEGAARNDLTDHAVINYVSALG